MRCRKSPLRGRQRVVGGQFEIYLASWLESLGRLGVMIGGVSHGAGSPHSHGTPFEDIIKPRPFMGDLLTVHAFDRPRILLGKGFLRCHVGQCAVLAVEMDLGSHSTNMCPERVDF
jgi:hypothetical protein